MPPQYESLSAGLARRRETLFAPVTPETAVMTSLAILGLTIPGRHCAHCRYPAPHRLLGHRPAVTGRGRGAVLRRLLGLEVVAVPLAALQWSGVAGPSNRGRVGCGPGTVGGAHLFIAALALAVLTCGIVTVTRRNLTLAVTVVTLCGIGGLVAAVRMWQPVHAQRLGNAP